MAVSDSRLVRFGGWLRSSADLEALQEVMWPLPSSWAGATTILHPKALPRRCCCNSSPPRRPAPRLRIRREAASGNDARQAHGSPGVPREKPLHSGEVDQGANSPEMSPTATRVVMSDDSPASDADKDEPAADDVSVSIQGKDGLEGSVWSDVFSKGFSPLPMQGAVRYWLRSDITLLFDILGTLLLCGCFALDTLDLNYVEQVAPCIAPV